MAAALPRVGIALGDPAGVGPEIALKAALDARVKRICHPVLFGDPAVLEEQASRCGIAWSKAAVELVPLSHFVDERLEIGQISTTRIGKNAYRADITVRGRTPSVVSNAIAAIDDLPGVDIISSSTAD